MSDVDDATISAGVDQVPVAADAPLVDTGGDEVMAGCEPLSHVGTREAGVLVLHGFTGNPSSMRNQAEAFAELGFHVEMPRLPGHGTTIGDMLTTSWIDWTREVEAAYQRLAERVSAIVVMGLSMGGSLTLWTGLAHPEVNGLVCVNPATQPQPDEVMEMLAEMLEDGITVMPAIGSDIADESVAEIAYDGTPVGPLLSLNSDGLTPMADRYGELVMPVVVFVSRNDHVVDPASSEYLAANVGGACEVVWLDRSFHVATQDFDRDRITAGAASFIAQVTGA